MTNSENSNTGKIEILEERENPFPEDLEGRLNAITNVVNTELKALTLLHLDDKYADKSEIKSRLRDTVDHGIYLPKNHSFGAYCSKSLLPIGAIAEGDIQIIDARGSTEFTGYKLTEAGKKYGRLIAAFTLDYVAKTGKSMFEILGSTMSRGKTRAPLNRIRILEHLRNEGELRLSDLSELFQTNNSNFILNNLKPLSRTGFVNFESVGDVDGSSFVVYEWIGRKNPKEVKPYKCEVSLTKKISEALFAMECLNIKETRILVGPKNTGNVSSILSYLVREGFAKRNSEFSADKQSKIRLLESGKQFLSEWVEPVKDALQDRGSLSEMRKLYDDLINDEQRFSDVSITGIELYTKISPNVNRRPRKETNREIIKYLMDNSGSRPKEITKKLNLSSVSINLTPLVKLGILTKEKEGKTIKYFVDEVKARKEGLLI
tara:strand:- start:265 stop:1563 length:1299 start_codon:yes stop_codon:yes gene_type:complete